MDAAKLQENNLPIIEELITSFIDIFHTRSCGTFRVVFNFHSSQSKLSWFCKFWYASKQLSMFLYIPEFAWYIRVSRILSFFI